MVRFRAFLLPLFVAAAVALGQYAGALHALGHATEQLSQKPGSPAKLACDQCFACSQLSSGATSLPPALPAQSAASEAPARVAVASRSVTRVVFLSRAPPVLS